MALFEKNANHAARSRVALMIAVTGIGLTATGALAQTNWINAGSGDWNAAGNWSNGIPAAGVDAQVTNGGTALLSTPGAQAGGLFVGGAGSLTIQGGGTLNQDVNGGVGVASVIGDGVTAASMLVQGTGSIWTTSRVLSVGVGSSLTLQNGGVVTGVSNTQIARDANLLVQGAGSVMTTGTFSSEGNLVVRSGGTLNTGTTSGIGQALVDGAGSNWTMGTWENNGDSSSLTTVRNGGALSAGAVYIGDSQSGPGAAPAVLIDGAGSSFTAGGLTIGRANTGTVTLQNGGRLSSSNEVLMSPGAGNSATLNVGTGANAGVLDVPSVNAVFGAGASTVNFNHVDNIAVATTFSGTLSLNKRGLGSLQVNGANNYSGPTAVEGGTLRAGAANVFSPNSAHAVSPGATLDLAGFDQTLPSLTNAGTVSLVGTAPGTSLNVTGAYVGNGGVLRLGTRLGDSASATDRLVLNGPGASASGSTTVQITNLGGLGAATTGNGIEVIAARNGATTTAQTTQNAFTLANGPGVVAKGTATLQATTAVGGHVDAGAYEYRLYAADASGAGESWYLRSSIPVVASVGAAPVAGTGAAQTAAGVLVADFLNPVGQVTAYRPEVPLYASVAAQLRQGNLAMLGNRHQRIGDDDPAPGAGSGQAMADPSQRRAWGRVLSTDLDIRQGGTVSPSSQGRLSGFQVGTDLFANREWRAGVYVGQLDGSVRVTGFASGIVGLDVGSTDLRSQYFGAYGTYTPANGWYVDAVLQAGRHRYTVQPTLNLATRSKGDSLLASVEVGKSFDLGEGGQWKIEPSVQLAHQRLSLDDSVIPGAVVQQDPHSGWIARAGVRVKGEFATGAGLLQPYARVNFYRASGGNDLSRFVGPAGSTGILSAAGSSSTELAGGFTLALNESVSIYGEAGKLWSSSGDAKVKSGVQGSLGLRVRW